MNKKRLLMANLISVLLLSGAIGTMFVNVGTANPFYGGLVPPDSSAKPPEISIFAPQNNTIYTSNTIPFSINVSLPESQKAYSTALDRVYYNADWPHNQISLYASTYLEDADRVKSHSGFPHYYACNINFTDVPDGNHTVQVYAFGGGAWVEDGLCYSFEIDGFSSVYFTIDTLPPEVILSVENITFYTTDVPLNFTVSEPYSQVTYSLDGRENVTIAGNTTLTNLSYGEHNVTVYAKDVVGHIGASETAAFTVAEEPEPFPTTLVAVASGVSVGVIAVGLLVYFKKRKH